jgi:hypothetical protein
VSTELIRVILPPYERWQLLQVDNLFSIISTIGFQVARLLGLAPTGIPKNLKGMVSERQDKKAEPAAKKEGSIFKPYN